MLVHLVSKYAFLFIFGAFVAGVIVGRLWGVSFGYSYQNRGEALLSDSVKRHFGLPDYHLMNHITLQMSDGTTQIDHILVSRFGVFVIEIKDYKGWIFASANQPSWTQVLFDFKFRFQNPILQNFRHVCAVRELLDFLPPDVVKSVVVFTGNATFKNEIPSGVFTLPDFVDYLHEQKMEVLSPNRVQFCVGRLETARLAITGETDVAHVQNLERRHGSQVGAGKASDSEYR